MRTVVSIGPLEYWLAPDADVDRLKAEVLAVVRAGGGSVQMPLPVGREATAVVMRGALIMFKQLPDAEAHVETGPDDGHEHLHHL